MSDPVDDFSKMMKRAQMTEKEKTVDDISNILAGIVILLLVSTSFWAIIHFIFLLPVTWLQVFGALVLLNLVKSLFR
jgi:predicted permease